MRQKTVRELRESLNQFVPDAFYDFDPQVAYEGMEKAVPLWTDDSFSVTFSDLDSPQGRRAPETQQIDDGNIEGSVEEIFEFGAEVDSEITKAALGGTSGEKIRQSVVEKGIDALAFYVTLHAKGVQWGIYVRISSILFLGSVFSKETQADWNTCLKLAFRCLHQHELFHFATDYFASQIELLIGEPCMKPAHALRDLDLGYVVLEEKCANAQMLRALERPPASLRAQHRMRALRQFVSFQPKGYCDAIQAKTRKDFEFICGALAQEYMWAIDVPTDNLDAINYMALYPRWPSIDWRYCPVHIIHDEQRLNLSIIDILRFVNISAIFETDRFTKQFSVMSKPLHSKWDKVKRQLQQSTSLPGLDFKFWERRGNEPVYSVRLDKGYRAHLRYNRNEQRWYADAVGDHKSMGHG
jgi:hypothetical protein